MSKTLKAFVCDESGVTAIEYGLIATLVAVVAVTGFTNLGGKLVSVFTGISSKMVIPV